MYFCVSELLTAHQLEGLSHSLSWENKGERWAAPGLSSHTYKTRWDLFTLQILGRVQIKTQPRCRGKSTLSSAKLISLKWKFGMKGENSQRIPEQLLSTFTHSRNWRTYKPAVAALLTLSWLSPDFYFFLNLIVHNIGTIASCECYSPRGENFERRVCVEIPKSPKRWVFRWHFKHQLGYKLGRYALSGTIKCTSWNMIEMIL